MSIKLLFQNSETLPFKNLIMCFILNWQHLNIYIELQIHKKYPSSDDPERVKQAVKGF